jgi:hypothetical protein
MGWAILGADNILAGHAGRVIRRLFARIVHNRFIPCYLETRPKLHASSWDNPMAHLLFRRSCWDKPVGTQLAFRDCSDKAPGQCTRELPGFAPGFRPLCPNCSSGPLAGRRERAQCGGRCSLHHRAVGVMYEIFGRFEVGARPVVAGSIVSRSAPHPGTEAGVVMRALYPGDPRTRRSSERGPAVAFPLFPFTIGGRPAPLS